MNESDSKISRGIFYLLIFMGIILAGTILKIMRSVLQPVVLSILLSFVFYPFIKKLNEKCKIPWVLAIVIIYAVFFVIFYLIANMLTVSLMSIIEVYPRYEERFLIIYGKLQHSFTENSNLFKFFNFNEEQTLIENINKELNILPFLKNFAVNFTGSIVTFTKNAFLVFLMSIFLLLEMKFTKNKIYTAFNGTNKEKIHGIMHSIALDTAHYVSIKFFISLATGSLVFLCSLLAGIDFPFVWGFVAFLLNFVPTFGSIISCALTILFTIVQFYPSPFPIVFISIAVVTINLILGNILEPRIEGENLGISPFVILVSLSIWGWLWGFLGLILAVPLMVIIKIFCENISYLNPIAVLLGSGKK